ncbi:MAG: hypothetical protein WC758_04125 [Candidatus Woesearchaeota archaeon]|jgi:hypothetical protein
MLDFEIIQTNKNFPLEATLNEHLINLRIKPTGFNLIMKAYLLKLGFNVDYPTRIMADLPDYYEASADALLYMQQFNVKIEESKNISKFRKHSKGDPYLIVSTSHLYLPDSLEATIIDNSTRINKEQPRKVLVPDYQGVSLNNVLSTEVGLKYLQVLFNTSNDASKIEDTLSALTGFVSNKIMIWTPSQESREERWYDSDFQSYKSGSVSVLSYCNDAFYLFNNFRSDFKGIAFEKIYS